MENAISVKNLCKKYNDIQAVDNVSFTVSPGEVMVIVGPNGAGKTTTLEICEGLRTADKGEVQVLGKTPGDKSTLPRIGVQLDETQFNKNIKVKEIVEFFRVIYKNRTPNKRVLDLLEIEKKNQEFYGNLSKGWKQRINIAMSVMHDPEVVFLDEVSSGLDPHIKHAIWDLIIEMKEQGKTIVLTTHSMDEAETLGDRILILHEGKVKMWDEPGKLVRNFIGTHKIELRSTENINVGENVISQRKNGKVVYFTNSPEQLKAEIHGKLGDVVINENKVNLEDIYMYYTN